MAGLGQVRRRPSHAVNDGLVVDIVEVPTTVDVDIDATATRVQSLHGAEAAGRYRHFFSRALAACAEAEVPGDDRHTLVLTLGALAAWRAGTVEIRTDALRRLDIQLGASHPAPAALAAALGLDPADLPAFIEVQRRSRFGWPHFGSGEHIVAYVGGFAGLDGPWITPPVAVAATGEPGVFDLRAGDEHWRAECDIFGTRLVRADENTPPETAGDHAGIVEADGAPENGELTSHLAVSEYEYVAVLTSTLGESTEQRPAVSPPTDAAVA
jgi:hypothetical protein